MIILECYKKLVKKKVKKYKEEQTNIKNTKKKNKGVSIGEIHNLSSPIKQGTLDFSYLPVSRYISKTPQKKHNSDLDYEINESGEIVPKYEEKDKEEENEKKKKKKKKKFFLLFMLQKLKNERNIQKNII